MKFTKCHGKENEMKKIAKVQFYIKSPIELDDHNSINEIIKAIDGDIAVDGNLYRITIKVEESE